MMKARNIMLSVGSLFAVIVLLVSSVSAQVAIRLEMDVPMNQVTFPTTVSFYLYNSKTAAVPVAAQDFAFGEWSADFEFWKFKTVTQDMVRVKVDFTEISALKKDMDLWVEMRFDGALKGERKRIEKEAWALFAGEAYNADDVYDRDINPKSVTITGFGEVIDSNGQWVGSKAGLQTGPAGISCWDLNANRLCDLLTEDENYDMECNALDCQGPKGKRGDSAGITVKSSSTRLAADAMSTVTSPACENEQVAYSGSCELSPLPNKTTSALLESKVSNDGFSWVCTWDIGAGQSVTGTVKVLCGNP